MTHILFNMIKYSTSFNREDEIDAFKVSSKPVIL